MNEIIELLTRHRSIRRFKSDEVPESMLEAIVRSAQQASSSSNVQAYSVIAVTNPDLKRTIADIAGGQKHVEQCPLLLVWCADLARNRLVCEQEGVELAAHTAENVIVATVDAALAAQNAAVAAESLGLGIVYIGGIRNNLSEVSRLLHLPQQVYPVFGMCVGFPADESAVRPRLPMRAILHREAYSGESDQLDAVAEYDRITRAYYIERTQGRRDTTWSREMADKFRRPTRLHVREQLEQQGFRFE